jgi:hypothetical protein
VPKLLKVDITDKITGKFKEGYLELYSSKYRIGKLYLKEDSNRYELSEGYLHEDGRFYILVNLQREQINVHS